MHNIFHACTEFKILFLNLKFLIKKLFYVMYVYQLVEESVNKYLNMLPNKLSTNKKLQTTP